MRRENLKLAKTTERWKIPASKRFAVDDEIACRKQFPSPLTVVVSSQQQQLNFVVDSPSCET